MPRARRYLAAGAYYHVTTRGNNKAPIALDAEDRRLFAHILRRGRGRAAPAGQAPPPRPPHSTISPRPSPLPPSPRAGRPPPPAREDNRNVWLLEEVTAAGPARRF